MSQPPKDKPSYYSLGERLFNLVVGLVLLAYGIAGFLNDKLSISSRGRLIALLEGGPAWLMAAAAVLGATVLLSVLVDHYDRRDNERHYLAFRWAATRLGWCATPPGSPQLER